MGPGLGVEGAEGWRGDLVTAGTPAVQVAPFSSLLLPLGSLGLVGIT